MRMLKMVLVFAPIMAAALFAGSALAQTPESYKDITIYLDGSDTPAKPGDELILGDGEISGVAPAVESDIAPEPNRAQTVAAFMRDSAWVVYILALLGFIFGGGALFGRMTFGYLGRAKRRRRE